MINTFDWFAKWSEYSPGKIAVKIGETGEAYSYVQLNRAANALARELTEKHRLKKGDRIAVISDNTIYQVVLFAAALKTGIILVPLNFRLATEELQYMLKDSGSALLYYRKDLLEPGITKGQCAELPIESIDTYFNSEESFESVRLDETDPVFILYTSGTTGFPKGAVYTHKVMFWNSVNTALSLSLTSSTTTLNCMPLFHTGGWNVFLTPILHHGGSILLFNKFEPDAILRCVEEERLDLIMAVPTMLKMMAEHPNFQETDLSSLKYLIVGGESMPIPLIDIYHRKGIPVRQGYGLTEAGPNLTSLHQHEAKRKEGSIGKPNFYVDIRIVDDNDTDVPANTPGELLIGGPMVTPGYWNRPEDTAAARLGNWLRTGDVARQDEEGFIYIVDRKKNMYISGGENVYPVEVERVLRSHPGIDEVVVVGVPDDRWGESGAAFLVGKDLPDETALRAFCTDKLAKFKIPKYVVPILEIPKNDTGKQNKKLLREQFIRQELSLNS